MTATVVAASGSSETPPQPTHPSSFWLDCRQLLIKFYDQDSHQVEVTATWSQWKGKLCTNYLHCVASLFFCACKQLATFSFGYKILAINQVNIFFI